MKIIVIGATGTIGQAVADALAAKHEVIRASRKSALSVDVEDAASVAAMFEKIQQVDAVVSCGGDVRGLLGPLHQLTDAQFQGAFRSMMAAVNLVRTSAKHLRDGGSITLTTGILSTRPIPGSSAGSMAGAGIEGFVRAAALEMPRRVRVNSVSPGWVKETMEKRGMDSSSGMSAKALAGFYARVVEGEMNGKIVDPTA